MNTAKKKIFIYHDNCVDGFMSAMAAYLSGQSFDFVAAKYGQEPPDVTDAVVVMADFSYKKDVLLKMAEKASFITILDHHKTAKDDLVDLPGNVSVTFDMDKSGCVLAYEFFFPGLRIPKIFLYVQDRDLWKFEFEESKYVHAYLTSVKNDFEVWKELIVKDSQCKVISEIGQILYYNRLKLLSEHAINTKFTHNFEGYKTVVVNTLPSLASETCDFILQNETDDKHQMAMCFYISGEWFHASLRSLPGSGVDVSAIAKKYGGGGHANAAGFKTKTEMFKED